MTVRADSGFFSYDMIAAVGAHGACYSITIPQNAKVKAANEAIGEGAWKAIQGNPGELHVLGSPTGFCVIRFRASLESY